jgi:hypothetical protein
VTTSPYSRRRPAAAPAIFAALTTALFPGKSPDNHICRR